MGLTLVVTRGRNGFGVKPLMNSYFIPCIGASDAQACLKAPDEDKAWSVRSIWPGAERAPDETAIAICEHLWFSSAAIPADE